MNTDEMTNEVSETARGWAEGAKNLKETVKETAQDWSQSARGRARDASAAADLYVHEYAWTTVALVALASAALGFWLGRTRD